jgi:hypothetical protein
MGSAREISQTYLPIKDRKSMAYGTVAGMDERRLWIVWTSGPLTDPKEQLMSEVSNDTIGEINHLHQLATQKAHEAVDYARQAGLLLLAVKKELPHGQFGPWIEANLQVSVRQCQRYMNVAEGNEVSIRDIADKNDTMSHLQAAFTEAELDQITAGTWVPSWVPEDGHWYVTQTAGGSYWVVPDLVNPLLFHVSRLYDDPENDDEMRISLNVTGDFKKA